MPMEFLQSLEYRQSEYMHIFNKKNIILLTVTLPLQKYLPEICIYKINIVLICKSRMNIGQTLAKFLKPIYAARIS